MSVLEEKRAVYHAIKNIPEPVILELGANCGEEFRWIKHWLKRPSLNYTMVEPDPNNANIIRKECHGITLVQAAIGKEDGKQIFHASTNRSAKNRASGSLLNPTGHLVHFPEVTFEKIAVNVFTLDSLIKELNLDHIDLLWCDIQGAESQMIQGGQETLSKTKFMMIEAEPEVELYEGQALKPQLIEMLPDWEVLNDFGYNLFMKNRNAV